MADIWTALIQNLNAMGFYGFVLPWLFIFAVVYGLLSKANLFAGVNKQVSAILALVIAFFGTAIGGPQLAAFFISLFGEASIYIAGILVVILFLVLVGVQPVIAGKGKPAWVIGIFLVVLAAIIFMTATGTIVTGIALDETAIAALFVVVVIALAVWFVMSGNGAAASGGAQPAGQPK